MGTTLFLDFVCRSIWFCFVCLVECTFVFVDAVDAFVDAVMKCLDNSFGECC